MSRRWRLPRFAARSVHGPEIERAVSAKRRVQVSLVVLIALLAVLLATGLYGIFALYNSAENRYIHLLFPLRTTTRDSSSDGERGDRRARLHDHEGSDEPADVSQRKKSSTADVAELERLTRTSRCSKPGYARSSSRSAVCTATSTARSPSLRTARSASAERARTLSAATSCSARFRGNAAAMEADIALFVDQTRADQRRTFGRAVGLLVTSGVFALAIAFLLAQRVPERCACSTPARSRPASALNAMRMQRVRLRMCRTRWCSSTETTGSARGMPPPSSCSASPPMTFSDGGGRTSYPGFGDFVARSDGDRDLTPVRIGDEERWLAVAVSEFDGGRVFTLRDATVEHLLSARAPTSSPRRRTSCARP